MLLRPRVLRWPLLPLVVVAGALTPLAQPLVALASAQVLQARQPQAANPPVRVLLAEASAVTLTALEQPLRIEPGDGLLAPGQSVRLLFQNGAVVLDDGRSQRRLAGASGLWIQAVPLRPLVGEGTAETRAQAGDFQLQQRRYRGRLQVLPGSSSLQAINHVALESYLPSVVGSEMPASWPQEALRAQAVAARTYALRQRKPAASFDVSATVSSQVYKGLEAETPSTREAVAATRGEVLTYDGQLANAVFHSSAGGTTENSGDIWRQQLPYLVSVPDFDTSSPVSQWELRLEPQQLRQAFRETGGVNRIDVLATTGSGRVRQARVVGPSGTLVLTGPELRSRLGLRSTLVRFEVVAPELAAVPLPPPPLPSAAPALEPEPLQVPQPALLAVGRGFGHGVGMSQWGALAMAQQGRSYQQILSHYYRGTVLRAYAAP